ncbi:MAG TPA: RsbRD N-terminal domain-containing protein [Kofleriaceae bacterium]
MSEGPKLASVLRERSSEILASWIVRFERSPLRFRRAAKASTYTAQVASLVEALTEAVHGGSDALRPGSDATRELERSAAFLGAQFASEGATGYDIAAVLLELRDVVAGSCAADEAAALTRLFEWLTVIALDGFAASGLQSLREQISEQLESGTPVIEVLPKVPAVLIVGAPSASVLDNLLARAWMMAVSVGAPCLVIDCGGIAEAGERTFERAFASFLEQAEGSALQVLVSTARRPLRELAAKMTAERGLSFQHFDRFDTAIAHSLERAGHLLMRRS